MFYRLLLLIRQLLSNGFTKIVCGEMVKPLEEWMLNLHFIRNEIILGLCKRRGIR